MENPSQEVKLVLCNLLTRQIVDSDRVLADSMELWTREPKLTIS